MHDFSGLPGAEIVLEGLKDQAAARETIFTLLITIAGSRLRRLGVPVAPAQRADAELLLYRALAEQDPETAYSRYNSLLRRVDSFAHSLEREHGKQIRQRVAR